jgi:hypothetical protein
VGALVKRGGVVSRHLMTVAAAVLAGAVGLVSSPAGAAAAQAAVAVGGAWGTAQELPGSAALNSDGGAEIVSVSCGSPGGCSAGGSYTDSSGHAQAMVDAQTNGAWGTAEEVPGIATLDTGGGATITSVSCASAGNCSAGGDYSDGSGHGQAFVVSQAGGTWGTAKEVPGTATLNKGWRCRDRVCVVRCSGQLQRRRYYTDSSHRMQALVDSQT